MRPLLSEMVASPSGADRIPLTQSVDALDGVAIRKPAGRLFTTDRSDAGVTGSGFVNEMVSVLTVPSPIDPGAKLIVAEGGCANDPASVSQALPRITPNSTPFKTLPRILLLITPPSPDRIPPHPNPKGLRTSRAFRSGHRPHEPETKLRRPLRSPVRQSSRSKRSVASRAGVLVGRLTGVAIGWGLVQPRPDVLARR
jgi:hypothetical protein